GRRSRYPPGRADATLGATGPDPRDGRPHHSHRAAMGDLARGGRGYRGLVRGIAVATASVVVVDRTAVRRVHHPAGPDGDLCRRGARTARGRRARKLSTRRSSARAVVGRGPAGRGQWGGKPFWRTV